MTLLGSFDYRVDTSPCDSTATRLRGVAEFDTDISAVFPYLNALFENSEYTPEVPAIRITTGGRKYAIHARRIIAPVHDITEAHQAFRHIQEVINDTWQRRSEIEPKDRPRTRPSPLELYKVLPKTNCGQCGEKACMAFASKLASHAAQPEDCPTLDAAAKERLLRAFD